MKISQIVSSLIVIIGVVGLSILRPDATVYLIFFGLFFIGCLFEYTRNILDFWSRPKKNNKEKESTLGLFIANILLFLSIFLLMILVVPKFERMFSEENFPLPKSTLNLISIPWFGHVIIFIAIILSLVFVELKVANYIIRKVVYDSGLILCGVLVIITVIYLYLPFLALRQSMG